jgi:hypothetical protein
LCIAAVNQKYKVELDVKYKLPKMKYKGNNVQLQRIRKKNASNIQEVGSAPVPGESKDARSVHNVKEEDSGLKSPDFTIFYALPEAGPLDGFSANWGPVVEDQAALGGAAHINALDLPVYHTSSWKDNIRGSMKNQADREKDEQATVAAQKRTRELLIGRICVVQVRMPDLDKHVAALKQFRVEVSDECLKIVFPPLPKSATCMYAPLKIWWPMPFHSAEAVADWNPETDTLQVSLPSELPDGVSNQEFGPQPLEALS